MVDSAAPSNHASPPSKKQQQLTVTTVPLGKVISTPYEVPEPSLSRDERSMRRSSGGGGGGGGGVERGGLRVDSHQSDLMDPRTILLEQHRKLSETSRQLQKHASISSKSSSLYSTAEMGKGKTGGRGSGAGKEGQKMRAKFSYSARMLDELSVRRGQIGKFLFLYIFLRLLSSI
jgi:hypothetical protein